MTLDRMPFLTEAQIWNGLARHFEQPLPLSGAQVTLSEVAAPDAQSVRWWGSAFVEPVSCALTAFPFSQFAGTDLTLEDVQSLPRTLSEGLLLGALEILRGVLPQAIATNLHEMQPIGAPRAHPVWLRADFALSEGPATVLLGASRSDVIKAIQLVAPEPGAVPPRIPAGLLDGLQACLTPQFGTLALPLGRLKKLKRGDVLLPAIDPARRELCGDGFSIIVHHRVADDGTGAWSFTEMTMTDDAAPIDDAPTDLTLDDLPVTLAFATGTRKMPLKDLYELSPGSLLSFDVSDLQSGLEVRILANGVQVGSGHLVQLDANFAVRINKIAPKTP